MNNTNDLYNRWLAQPDLDDAVKAELVSIAGDSDAVTDRFYRDLEFGTGGLRGVIGAGTNRMNLYTVRKATQGLADYLNASGLPKKVAIAHDSRHNGALFARETARVLAANGITACMYPRLEPTPALSWAVRYLGCGAGVCVTASHNPAKYNGYKVYGADGCQITLEAAEKILAAIEKIDCFDDVRLADFDAAAAAGRIVTIDEKCLDDFVQAVYDQRVGDGAGIDALKLVYTPLNGTGLECVKKLLKKLGVTHVTVVPEQEKPDGDFPTCPYPNPEIREAMQKGLELCDKVRPDLLLGTDPDCDRCGTAVPDGKGGYRLITGNEMGIILLDYICRTRLAQGTMPADPVAVTTIVSTDMAAPVAKKSASRSASWRPRGVPNAISSALRRATATCPAATSATRTLSTRRCWSARPRPGTPSRARRCWTPSRRCTGSSVTTAMRCAALPLRARAACTRCRS